MSETSTARTFAGSAFDRPEWIAAAGSVFDDVAKLLDDNGVLSHAAVHGKILSRGIADDYGCDLVDLWSMRALNDTRAWSPDRLHLTAEGHRRVALRTCEVLGIPVTEDWRAPFPGPFLYYPGRRRLPPESTAARD